MKKYSSTVVTSLAGHTHMDDFRLMDDLYIHITPAVSPMFSNNPTYESIEYSPASGAITDYTVFNLPLGNTPAAWSTEYTFSTAYNHASFAAVHAAIATDPATRALYMQYYTSSNAKSTTITPQNWFGYWCGTGSANATAFWPASAGLQRAPRMAGALARACSRASTCPHCRAYACRSSCRASSCAKWSQAIFSSSGATSSRGIRD